MWCGICVCMYVWQALGRALPEDEDAVEAPLAMSMEELEAQMLWPEKSHIKVGGWLVGR